MQGEINKTYIIIILFFFALGKKKRKVLELKWGNILMSGGVCFKYQQQVLEY